jgi:hypothetical protein
LPGCSFLFAIPSHARRPTEDSSKVQVLPLRSVWSGDACCASWRWGRGAICQRIRAGRCTNRNNSPPGEPN